MLQANNIKKFLQILLLSGFLWPVLQACEPEYSPKPRGFFRIELPEHQYQKFQKENCPFFFDYSKYSHIEPHKSNNPCWFNIEYSGWNATVHFSYFNIDTNSLSKYVEDSYTLATKHLLKASDMEESTVHDPNAGVYGVIYDFKGATASNYQFFLTDSTHHFVRGALYFNVVPQPDSLAPVETYIEQDLFNLIKSFNWK